MVQLRVDVEAARARSEFERAARAVDDLGDELTNAEIDALRLEDAMDDTAREAARLRAEVARLGSGAPQQLRDDLLAAERAALQARIAFERADDSVEQLERSLAEARREADRLERELDDLDADAARGFRSLQRMFLGAANSGRESGANFAKNFLAGMNGPIAVGIAAVALALGATLNAILLTAIGGGVMAAAVAVAIKQSDVLQKSFTDTFRAMGNDVKQWSSGFEDELLGVSRLFAGTWRGISDELRDVFAIAQTFVEPLAKGLSDLIDKMVGGGGFKRAMEAAGPVIAELGVGLSRMGDAFDSFFDSLADGGDGAVKGMIVLMALLSGGLRLLGNTIEFVSKWFDAVTTVAEEFASSMAAMLGWLPGVGHAWRYIAETLQLFNSEAGKTTSIMPILGAATDDTGAALDREAAAARKAGEAAVALSNKLHGLITDQMSAQQAAIAWEEAIDNITASVQENGRNLDIGTEKGRANTQAILQAVSAAEAKRQADIALAGGEKASQAAVEAANAAFRAQVAQLEATLQKMGFTKAQIDALLGSYRSLAAAPNIYKTITFRTVATGPMINAAQQSGAYGGLGGYAAGTPSAPPGWAIVGEKGPELVRFAGGESVYTADETARMMTGSMAAPRGAGAGAAGGSVIQAELVAGPGGGGAISELLYTLIRSGALRLVVRESGARVGVVTTG
jgi:hypothetical protein